MTTPQKPSGTGSTHRHTGAAVPSVTGWLDHTAVVQAIAYLCAGGFVVGLLTAATTVAWRLLATALTADTATYGLRALRDRTHRDGASPMTDGAQRNKLHPSGFHAARDGDAAPLAAYRRATTMTQIGDNRSHPLEERNQSSWRYRPVPHRR